MVLHEDNYTFQNDEFNGIQSDDFTLKGLFLKLIIKTSKTANSKLLFSFIITFFILYFAVICQAVALLTS